jgi:integrase
VSSLYLRGKTVWVSYSDRFGRRKRQSTGFTLDRVERRAGRILWPRHIADWHREFDRRLVYHKWDFHPEGQAGHKLSSILAGYLAAEGSTRKPLTRYSYEYAWQQLIDHFGDIEIERIAEGDMIGFRSYLLAKKWSEHTAARILRSVQVIFSWAELKGIIRRSPVTRYHSIRARDNPIRIFTAEELEQIFKAARPAQHDQLRFLLLTGFRLGESCQLKWEDIDFASQVIRVYNLKEERWEYVPMDKTLRTFLEGLPHTFDPFVFQHRKVITASQAFRRLRDRLELPEDLHIHMFRANFISSLVNSGLSESQVMQLARHRSLATSHKYYTAFDQSKLRKALARSRKQKGAKREDGSHNP